MLPFEVTKSLSCIRKPPSILYALKASVSCVLSACVTDNGGGRGDIVYSLLLLWCSAVIEKRVLVPGCAAAAASRCGFFDWQKQMSITFISESLRRCQCHLTVSSNLCNGSGRNCQACLSSISHTSWKSRLGCHSCLIHTGPEALWVDLVQDISEVEQQTIKLFLLTKQLKEPSWSGVTRVWKAAAGLALPAVCVG